jgi:hypothetical protein
VVLKALLRRTVEAATAADLDFPRFWLEAATEKLRAVWRELTLAVLLAIDERDVLKATLLNFSIAR